MFLVYACANGGRMRILIVEDERKVAEMIARGLRAERYAVDVAEDGAAGWAMANTYDYDLAVLDLGLPGMDGSELLRRIRRRNSRVPILILTARDATSCKVESFDAGADDYLTKPFAFEELSVRIRALLRRGSSEQGSMIRVGDLEINRLTQQVSRAGQRIDSDCVEVEVRPPLTTLPAIRDACCRGRWIRRTCMGPELRGPHEHRGRVCPAPQGKG